MALLSVVLAAAFGAVNVMQHQAMLTTDRFDAQGEAQTITDRITKDLRTAVSPSSTQAAFASADVNDITFTPNLSDPNGPTRLHAYLSVQGGTNVSVFHEDSTRADPGGSSGNFSYSGPPSGYATVNRLDGRYVDTSQSMFAYFNSDDTPIPTPITDVASLRSIDSVQITLRIRIHPGSPSITVQTLVHIRNVDYNPNT